MVSQKTTNPLEFEKQSKRARKQASLNIEEAKKSMIVFSVYNKSRSNQR
jgi:hypothetical protein